MLEPASINILRDYPHLSIIPSRGPLHKHTGTHLQHITPGTDHTPVLVPTLETPSNSQATFPTDPRLQVVTSRAQQALGPTSAHQAVVELGACSAGAYVHVVAILAGLADRVTQA